MPVDERGDPTAHPRPAVEEWTPADPSEDAAPAPRPVVHEPRRALEALLGAAFTEGNALDVYRDGAVFFDDLLGALRASRRSIDMLWFIWGEGPVTQEVADALADRARAGVRVRLLLDSFGGRALEGRQLEVLREAGCTVAFYRPLRTPRITSINMRTHRRALVVDETVAFTGGAGIDEAWTGRGDRPARWRDTSYRLRGPAVDGVRAAFMAAWLQTPHPLVSEHDQLPEHERAGDVALQVLQPQSQPGWNSGALAMQLLLQSATERVRISTPYARVPDELIRVLGGAVRRGVQVQLMTPGREVVDHPFARVQEEHCYQELLDLGIEVWHYQPSMLHSKLVSVDGERALVGTVNLDTRSIALNEQVGIVIDHAPTVTLLDRHYDEDLGVCRRLDPDEWTSRGRLRQVKELAASTLAQPMRGLGRWQLSRPRP